MHRITWQHAKGPTTWLIKDGHFQLPPTLAKSMGFRLLVMVGETAVSLDSAQPPGRLSCNGLKSPFTFESKDGEHRLHWEAICAPSPRPLEAAPTQDRPTLNQFHSRTAKPKHLHFRINAPAGWMEFPPHGIILMGRDSSCGIQLHDGGVSNFHCAIRREAAGLRFVDLGSRNGSFLNGMPVSQAFITKATRLTLGAVELHISCGQEGAARRLLRLPSREMAQLYKQVKRVAPTRAAVLITGPTGSGKEGVAQEIHKLSDRGGPFVVFNAATLKPNLAGSALFGHVRGAFTGARAHHVGAFEQANGGTLFLDEIGDLPLGVQAELLRVLECGQIRPIGSQETLQLDVRVVTATHKQLPLEANLGRFRWDLYHRIAGIVLAVPALKGRTKDITFLAKQFAAENDPPKKLSRSAAAILRRQAWPGNIRELRNVMDRSCALHDVELLEPEHLCFDGDKNLTLEVQALRMYDQMGSVAKAARALGIHRSTLYRYLRKARELQDNDPPKNLPVAL